MRYLLNSLNKSMPNTINVIGVVAWLLSTIPTTKTPISALTIRLHLLHHPTSLILLMVTPTGPAPTCWATKLPNDPDYVRLCGPVESTQLVEKRNPPHIAALS